MSEELQGLEKVFEKAGQEEPQDRIAITT